MNLVNGCINGFEFAYQSFLLVLDFSIIAEEAVISLVLAFEGLKLWRCYFLLPWRNIFGVMLMIFGFNFLILLFLNHFSNLHLRP